MWYLQYWDVKNLYRWAMAQKFPVNNFEWIKDNSQPNEDFIKNCSQECDERYFLDFDVQNLQKLHEFRNDLPFCLRGWRLKKLNSYTGYAIHIRNLKQANNLNHGLVLKLWRMWENRDIHLIKTKQKEEGII